MAGYAVVGSLQIPAWSPLGAVPGATLAGIRARMAGAREYPGTPLVVARAVAGILCGAGVLAAPLRRKNSAVGARRCLCCPSCPAPRR